MIEAAPRPPKLMYFYCPGSFQHQGGPLGKEILFALSPTVKAQVFCVRASRGFLVRENRAY